MSEDLKTVTTYLRELAQRIEAGEPIKVQVIVDAGGRSGGCAYGHKNIGEQFVQLEDHIFTQRMAFFLPQLLPQVQQALLMPRPSTLGSTH